MSGTHARTALGLLLAAWAMPLLGLSAACGQENIVIATLQGPSGDGGTIDGDGTGPVCTRSSQCATGLFCKKTQCQETTGTCEQMDHTCNGPAPVCGCDAITYYNDCLRQEHGVPQILFPHQCAVPSCGGRTNMQCLPGQSCAALLTFEGLCPPQGSTRDLPGTCWVLPDPCPTSTANDQYKECGSHAPCVDTCNAVREGGLYEPASQCMP
jgi:hypothetical protein